MNDKEVDMLITYMESDDSGYRKIRERMCNIQHIIDSLERIAGFADASELCTPEMDKVIDTYIAMLSNCRTELRDDALEWTNKRKASQAELDESLDDDESSYSNCDKDCCDCRTCRYYEEGPIQWGFADGEQVFGEGMCHEDDRRIVKKATGHKPCHMWKSVNDTSPDIDWP